MPRSQVWVFVFVLLCFNSALAQFKIERLSEDLTYQRAREVTFYSDSHFNRVEALYLNFGVKYIPAKMPGLAFNGDLGYGFKNEEDRRWRWRAGVQKGFLLPSQLTVGLDYFNKVETNDRWLISSFENSLAGIFLHEDFMDYFGKEGVHIFADYRLQQAHTLRLEVSGHRYESLQSNSNWSLLGRDKDYPPNPRTSFPTVPGDEISTRLTAVYDGRDNPVFPIYGWYADAQFEVTRKDFETTGLFLSLKRYQPTFGDQKFQIKLLLGARSGSFAQQHLLTLGGLGSLRGYREKEFVGNRMIYLTGNYVIGQQWLRHVPFMNLIPIWEAISLGVLAEAGLAWVADPQNPDASLFDPGNFELNDLRSDVGFSLFFADNLFRVDFARRTDRGNDNWRITFRILDKF